jgi:hypothetical protein
VESLNNYAPFKTLKTFQSQRINDILLHIFHCWEKGWLLLPRKENLKLKYEKGSLMSNYVVFPTFKAKM